MYYLIPTIVLSNPLIDYFLFALLLCRHHLKGSFTIILSCKDLSLRNSSTLLYCFVLWKLSYKNRRKSIFLSDILFKGKPILTLIFKGIGTL